MQIAVLIINVPKSFAGANLSFIGANKLHELENYILEL
jgi:hypothetical protein